MANLFRNFSVRTKYGAMGAVATAVFASIYVAGVYIYREVLRKEERQGPHLTRSMSIAVLHGGQLALQRLLECHEARADKSSVEVAECELKTHLLDKHPDYKKLQSDIAKLEMSGQEAKAVEILEKAIAKAHKDGKSHEAYETDMLLVEMLIYKGDFEEALRRECLRHVEISDARRPLYKAIIHIMLEDSSKDIMECWNEYNVLKEEFHSAPCSKEIVENCQLHKLRTDFKEFENVVKILRKDIEAQVKKITKK